VKPATSNCITDYEVAAIALQNQETRKPISLSDQSLLDNR
jgi:hypothetical protein